MVTEGDRGNGEQEGEVDEKPVDELALRRLERDPKKRSGSISIDSSVLPRLNLEAGLSELTSEELADLQETLNFRIQLSKKAEFESMNPMDRMNKLNEIEGEIFSTVASLNSIRDNFYDNNYSEQDRAFLSGIIVSRLSALAVDHKVLLAVLKENGQV